VKREERHDRQIKQPIDNPDRGCSFQIRTGARRIIEPPKEIPADRIACGGIITGRFDNDVLADSRDALAMT
jgi:hypothetical protein